MSPSSARRALASRGVDASEARFRAPRGPPLPASKPHSSSSLPTHPTPQPFLSTQFLCYKTLKKCLKSIPEAFDKAADETPPPGRRRQLTDEQRAFVKTLNAELQKFNRFFINSEEDFVMRETKLEEEFHRVLNDNGSRGPEFSVESHRRACRAFADFHGELVLLEHWVSLNYTALVKILKKHDKPKHPLLRSPLRSPQQPFTARSALPALTNPEEVPRSTRWR